MQQARDMAVTILKSMVSNDIPDGIQRFEELNELGFEIETSHSGGGSFTFLTFKPTEDMKFLRVEINHIFGVLDTGLDAQSAVKQLVLLMKENQKSFQTTSAYFGLTEQDNALYASLNSTHHFLGKWDPVEIGRALSMAFMDLMMGLSLAAPSATILQRFGTE